MEPTCEAKKEPTVASKLRMLDDAVANLTEEVKSIIGKLTDILSPIPQREETRKETGEDSSCGLNNRLDVVIRTIDANAEALRETSERIQI